MDLFVKRADNQFGLGSSFSAFWHFAKHERVAERTDRFFYGVVSIFILCAIHLIRSLVAERRHRHKCLEEISLELAHGEVEEAYETVEEIKCFQEPEHLMVFYLLRLSSGRIWVRWDYDSADIDGHRASGRTKFQIFREMTMVRFKYLDDVRYEFGPTKIRKPPIQLLNVPPDDWPEDETWLDIPWEDLDCRYSE